MTNDRTLAAVMLTAFVSGMPGCGGEARAASERPAAPAAGESLEATADMSVARAAHTATSLPDGRVLVAGGFSSAEDSANSAELFDSRTASFSPAPAMRVPRYSHSATLLANGKVLIAGGYGHGNTTLASAELYDPATGRFETTGTLAQARADHTAVLLSDGRVLVAGGLGPGWDFLASAELYDPRTGEFSPAGAMTVARESHTAVRLDDGRVLIAGGHRGRRAAIMLYASTEIFDPATGRFHRSGDMLVRRHKHDAVRLPDGRVLITGGADERDDRGVYRTTELFDPATLRFTAGRHMVLPRYKHEGTSVLLPDGRVLLAGGAAQAEIYDPGRAAFTVVSGSARMAGQFPAAALLGNGSVLVTGGYGQGRGPRASAWLYQP